MSASAYRLQICDACCCGTVEKHPDVDHGAQRAALTAAALGAGGSVRVMECLDECHASNVVVVRRSDGSSTWLGWVLDEHATADVCGWLADGAGELPEILELHKFVPKSNLVGQAGGSPDDQ